MFSFSFTSNTNFPVISSLYFRNIFNFYRFVTTTFLSVTDFSLFHCNCRIYSEYFQSFKFIEDCIRASPTVYSEECFMCAWEECVLWLFGRVFCRNLSGLIGLLGCSSLPFPCWSFISILLKVRLKFSAIVELYISLQFCKVFLHVFWGPVVSCLCL